MNHVSAEVFLPVVISMKTGTKAEKNNKSRVRPFTVAGTARLP